LLFSIILNPFVEGMLKVSMRALPRWVGFHSLALRVPLSVREPFAVKAQKSELPLAGVARRANAPAVNSTGRSTPVGIPSCSRWGRTCAKGEPYGAATR
jgi:hypothetical protein